jgi:hypothetical protein
VLFDPWQRLGNGAGALTVATADEVEPDALAEVAVLACCRIVSSSPLDGDAVVAWSSAPCSMGKVFATATFFDRWREAWLKYGESSFSEGNLWLLVFSEAEWAGVRRTEWQQNRVLGFTGQSEIRCCPHSFSGTHG